MASHAMIQFTSDLYASQTRVHDTLQVIVAGHHQSPPVHNLIIAVGAMQVLWSQQCRWVPLTEVAQWLVSLTGLPCTNFSL